ncbi:uncharacterized protein N7496_001134 [Penicillium cataractarum]|uniref:Uncharacterized protein n=1 Tax=Penicillium cataractarum TaxID=2100454 RepID=A0A9X0B6M7_9EURO|nr:uncharacterized protein N7496_001134 [Penicillium cataractarum]KAJ5390066.1 hypothetical protein N7496_001134 [Penicillium cataractarum]
MMGSQPDAEGSEVQQQVEQGEDTVPAEAVSSPTNEPAQAQATLGEDHQQTPLPNEEDASRSPGPEQESPEAIVDEARRKRRQFRPDAPSFIPSARFNPSAPSFIPSVTAGGSSNPPVSSARSSRRSHPLPARPQPPRASLSPPQPPQHRRPSPSCPDFPNPLSTPISPPPSLNPLFGAPATWQPSGDPRSPLTGNTWDHLLPSSLNWSPSRSQTFSESPSSHLLNFSASHPVERPSPTPLPARNQPRRRRLSFSTLSECRARTPPSRSPLIIWEDPESPDQIAMSHNRPSHPAYHQGQGRGFRRGYGRAHHYLPPHAPPEPTQHAPAGNLHHGHAGPAHRPQAGPTHHVPAPPAQRAPPEQTHREHAGPRHLVNSVTADYAPAGPLQLHLGPAQYTLAGPPQLAPAGPGQHVPAPPTQRAPPAQTNHVHAGHGHHGPTAPAQRAPPVQPHRAYAGPPQHVHDGLTYRDLAARSAHPAQARPIHHGPTAPAQRAPAEQTNHVHAGPSHPVHSVTTDYAPAGPAQRAPPGQTNHVHAGPIHHGPAPPVQRGPLGHTNHVHAALAHLAHAGRVHHGPTAPAQHAPQVPIHHSLAGPAHLAPAVPTSHTLTGPPYRAPAGPVQRPPAGPTHQVPAGPSHQAPLGAFPPAPPHPGPPGFDPTRTSYQTTVQDPCTGALVTGDYYPNLHTIVLPGPYGHPVQYPAVIGYFDPITASYPAAGFGAALPFFPLAAMPNNGRRLQGDPFAAGPRQFEAPPGHIALGPTLSMPRELAQPGTGQRSQAPGVPGVRAAVGVPADTGSRGSRPLIPTVPEFRPELARGVPVNEGQTARNTESTVSQRPQGENPSMGPSQPQQNRLRPAEWVGAASARSLFGSQVLPERPFGPWVVDPNGPASGFARRQTASAEEAPSRSATPTEQESGDGLSEPFTPPDQIEDPEDPSESSSSPTASGPPSTPWGQSSPQRHPHYEVAEFLTQMRAREEQRWAEQHRAEMGQSEAHASRMPGSQADTLRAIIEDPARFGLSMANSQANRLEALAGYDPRAQSRPGPGPASPSPARGQTPAAGLASQQLVSAFDQVFQNLASYAEGYSNYQGVPHAANTVGGRNVLGGTFDPFDDFGGIRPAAPLGPAVTWRQRSPPRWLERREGLGLRADPEEADAFHERLERGEASPGGPSRESGPQ